VTLRNTPFAPAGPNATVGLAAGPTPGAVQFDNILPPAQAPTGNPSQIPRRRSASVRVVNAGPSIAFIELIGANQQNPASPNNSLALLANSERVFATGGADFLAAVTAAGGSAQLYATPGEGGI
jgi:hypothetical protein